MRLCAPTSCSHDLVGRFVAPFLAGSRSFDQSDPKTWPTAAEVSVTELRPECGGKLKGTYSWIAGRVKCLSPGAAIVYLGFNDVQESVDFGQAYDRRVYAVEALPRIARAAQEWVEASNEDIVVVNRAVTRDQFCLTFRPVELQIGGPPITGPKRASRRLMLDLALMRMHRAHMVFWGCVVFWLG